MVEFGDSLAWTYVMGGLARDYMRDYEDREAGIGGAAGVYQGLVDHWLDVAAHSGMPIDPRLWTEGPLTSTYPACMAVKAAVEQGAEPAAAYLRVLREGMLCFRRKLDTTEALVEEARRVGLNVERFRIDLGSHAIVEAFGADLDLTRAIPEGARERGGAKMGQGAERLVFPTAVFEGEDGVSHAVYGLRPYEEYRAAAEAAGAVAVDGQRRACSTRSRASAAWRRRRSRMSAACRPRSRMRSCGSLPLSGRCGRCRCSPATCGSWRTESSTQTNAALVASPSPVQRPRGRTNPRPSPGASGPPARRPA